MSNTLKDLFTNEGVDYSDTPTVIQEFIERFNVDLTPSLNSHKGVLAPTNVTNLPEEIDVGIGKLILPFVNKGIPFTFQPLKGGLSSFNAWQLDIFLYDIILEIEGLTPAIYVEAQGTLPRHLLRDPTTDKVRIIGQSSWLRITNPIDGAGISFSFVEESLDSNGLSGSHALNSVVFSPSSFFIGSSDFGMTIGTVAFDLSDALTPTFINNTNVDDTWMGLAIQEATFYAPRNQPLVGDLSGGVRNLLLGKPLGLQGELEVQFGRSPLNPSTFEFKQLDPNNQTPTTLGIRGNDRAFFVDVTGDQDQFIDIEVSLTAAAPPNSNVSWTALWTWDDSFSKEGLSSLGTIKHTSQLKVEPIEIITKGNEQIRVFHPPILFEFLASGNPPKARAKHDHQIFEELIHISGTLEDVSLLELTAHSQSNLAGFKSYEWEILGEDIKFNGTTVIFDLTSKDLMGSHTIKLTEILKDGNRVTKLVSHINLDILLEAELIFGTKNGVFLYTDQTSPLQLSFVEATYSLSSFLSRGVLIHKPSQSHISQSNSTEVLLPSDGLAQVIVSMPFSTSTTVTQSPVQPTQYDRHVQVLFEYANDQALGWGTKRPNQNLKPSVGGEADLQTQLLQWAANYPGANFLIIGRCDDIGRGKPNIDDNNILLAKNRAKKGLELLTSLLPGVNETAVERNRICIRGETSTWITNSCKTKESSLMGVFITPKEAVSAVTDISLQHGWLMRHEYEDDYLTWVNSLDVTKDYEALRKLYRRIDIYAVGGTPSTQTVRKPKIEIDITRRKSYISGEDNRTTPAVLGTNLHDYRVKLRVKWDSPHVTKFKDAIPVFAEAEYAWTPDNLPDINGESVSILPPSQETLIAFTKWTHDASSGFTKTTLGIKSEGDADGLMLTENKTLVAALTFGPALMSAVDLNNDVFNAGARIAALIGIAAAGSQYLVKEGKVVLIKVESQAQTSSLSNPSADYQVRLLADYNCTVHADCNVLDIKTVNNRPLKVRYKNVGVEFDNSATAWRKIGLVYDSTSMEIVDSGQWKIEGILGELLRVISIEFGTGSLWAEVDLAVAIDLGIIEISEAVVRITYEDNQRLPKFELRGFEVKADIPNILKGSGRLRIEEGGLIRAGVTASIIPLGLSGQAALAMKKETTPTQFMFLSLYLGVQFATPLPLLPTTLAIYGFIGSFTMNGSRNINDDPDPIARELDWWSNKRPSEKYIPDHGQYALGLGVVIGTLPDKSFSFSASGMIVVAFPNPEVILGVTVDVLTVPDIVPKEKGDISSSMVGLVVINKDAILVHVAGEYHIPNLLTLNVPFSAYFPSNNNPNSDSFVRLGSDGITNIAKPRYGDKITLTLLPTTYDFRAWAFLMIEENGLESLGGNKDFSFDGFSVGFGAGWEIKWGANKFRLQARAKLLVGVGTDPLMIKGGVFIDGELIIGYVSISAHGEIILTYQNSQIFMNAKFCGKVKLFFFSLKGCVSINVGNKALSNDPPAPEPPLSSISLVDRKNNVMGMAVPSNAQLKGNPLFKVDQNGNNVGSKPADNNTVWPDTAPILQFSHYIKNDLSNSAQFKTSATPTQPIWFGSNNLKYTYKMDSLELRDITDPTNIVLVKDVNNSTHHQLQSTWMTSPYRQPNSSGIDNPLPSEHEGPNLKLLDWNFMSWVQSMDNGGKGTKGDPVRTIEELCKEFAQPQKVCLFGEDARKIGSFTYKLTANTSSIAPYPSRFKAVVRPLIDPSPKTTSTSVNTNTGELFEEYMAIYTTFSVVAAERISLPTPVQIHRKTLNYAFRLPTVQVPYNNRINKGLMNLPMVWEIVFDRKTVNPSLTLLVCFKPQYTNENRKWCEIFNNLKAYTTNQYVNLHLPTNKSKENPGFDIAAMDSKRPFTIGNSLNSNTTPHLKDQNRRPDLSIPHEGIKLSFVLPCKQIDLKLHAFDDATITILAYRKDKTVVQSQSITPRKNETLSVHLNAKGYISEVVIKGGGNEAVLYEICYSHKTKPSQLELTQLMESLPTVKGVTDEHISKNWQPSIQQSFDGKSFDNNSYCYLIEYQSPQLPNHPNWDSLRVQNSISIMDNLVASEFSIVSLCGTDKIMVDNHQADQQSLQETANIINNLSSLAQKNLLEAGHTYEVELGWSYQYWQSTDDSNSTPPNPDMGSWQTGQAQKLKFAVAHESTLSPDTQDGLNEHLFDPRDIARYLTLVEPINGATSHFTQSPLWVHFETSHVKQLLMQYGYDIILEVKRTDPPPKSTSDVSINKSLAIPLVPLLTKSFAAPKELNSVGYQRINDAVKQATCLISKPIVGGQSIQALFKLDKKSMYDFNILAVKKANEPPLVIHASRFKTSAYATPEALIEHLGFALDNTANPYLPNDIIIEPNTILPKGTMEVSDNLIDELLLAMGNPNLPLPKDSPKTYAIWRQSIHSAATWYLEGLLIDSLESLSQMASVEVNNEVKSSHIIKIDRAVVNNQTLQVHRANSNWTRVFLQPNLPIQITQNSLQPTNIELSFFSNNIALTGRKTIGSQPAILNREGL